MKKTLITCLAIMAILGAIPCTILAQNPGNTAQNNGTSMVVKKPLINIVRQKAIEFRNDQGQLVKTVSLQPDTTFGGKDAKGKKIKISAIPNTYLSKNRNYVGLRKIYQNKYKTGKTVWPPENETWLEYYNREGKLLWKHIGLTMTVSEAGEYVAINVPKIGSGYLKGEYEYPEADPNYCERLIIVDTTGNELYNFEAYIFDGYASLTKSGKFGMIGYKDNYTDKQSNVLLFSVDSRNTFKVPQSKLQLDNTEVMIKDNGDIVFTVLPADTTLWKRKNIIRGGITFTIIERDTIRIIKYGEW